MNPTRLKPLVKSRAPAFLVRRQRVHVTRALEEAIFRHADVLSEGSVRAGAGATQPTYFGSTMLSVDLASLGAVLRGLPTTDGATAILDAIDGSVRIRLRAMRMARAEAARRVHRHTMGTALCEIRMQASGSLLHIDVDLEVPLRVSSRAVRRA
jgi:hypothetical protein